MSEAKLFNYMSLPINLTKKDRQGKDKPIKAKLGRFKGTNGIITLQLYPLNVLSENLNRSSHTIRRWEKAGWIPKSTFRINKIRHYTKSQIQMMLYLTIKHDIRNKENVGVAMPQAFIDDVFARNRELVKFTLEGCVMQDLHQPRETIPNAKAQAK